MFNRFSSFMSDGRHGGRPRRKRVEKACPQATRDQAWLRTHTLPRRPAEGGHNGVDRRVEQSYPNGRSATSSHYVLMPSSKDAYYRYFKVRTLESALVAEVVEKHLQGGQLARLFRMELQQIAKSCKMDTLIVDFEKVGVISSFVISSLLSVQANVRSCRVVLCGVSAPLKGVFETLNLRSVFEIFESLDCAVLDMDVNSP